MRISDRWIYQNCGKPHPMLAGYPHIDFCTEYPPPLVLSIYVGIIIMLFLSSSLSMPSHATFLFYIFQFKYLMVRLVQNPLDVVK